MSTILCSDCSKNTSPELQYSVPWDDGETKIVCENCAKKYGFNLDNTKPYEHNF